MNKSPGAGILIRGGCVAVLLASALLGGTAFAQAFTPGNIVVLDLAAASTNTTR